MDDRKELAALLAKLEQASEKQMKFARWQCIFSAAAAVCCGAVLVISLCVIPKFSTMAAQAQAVITNAQTVTNQLAQADWEGLVGDLEQVTSQMAQADLGGLAEDVDSLVSSSQTGVEEALKKLNSIDLESLNKAISDLSDVIQPLAKFVNRFK